jgi:hypothetical protein
MGWICGQTDRGMHMWPLHVVIMEAGRCSETSTQLYQTSRKNVLECRPFTVVWCRKAVMLEVLSNEMMLVECRLIR